MRVWYGLPTRFAMRRNLERSLGSNRTAINCLACADLGRPTRLARRSSSSVDSGMSEKSISLSGVCLTFLATGLARADDSDRFFAID
jgi:hypothetical protein